MKRTLLLLAFTLLAGRGFSQNADSLIAVKQVDSLIQVSIGMAQQNDIDKALETIAAAEKFTLEKLGRETASFGTCCHKHGIIFYYKKDFAEAEKWLLEAKAIREKVLGKEHPDYVKTADVLADLYKDMSQPDAAESLYLEILNIREKVLGKENPDYATTLSKLGILNIQKAQYAKAEPYLLEALAIRGKVLGKEHPDYLSSLNVYGVLKMYMADYPASEQLFLEVKDLAEKTKGKESNGYISSITNLGIIYTRTGQYEKAASLCLESKAIIEKVFGKESVNYPAVLDNLASIYSALWDFEKAEQYYLEAKVIREKILGKLHPDYARTLMNLATLYRNYGYYEKAEALQLEAKAIQEKTLGKQHPEYASSLMNLARLYFAIGHYAKSEPLYLEVKNLFETALGKENPDYALTIQGLGELYYTTGNFQKAEPLLLEAKALEEKLLGKENPALAVTLAKLGDLYFSMGDYEQAELFCLEAKDMSKIIYTNENPVYALALFNLACVYYAKGDLAKAEQFYLEAKSVYAIVYGSDYGDYTLSLARLAKIYQRTNRISASATALLESNILNRQRIEKLFAYLSENEMLAYLKAVDDQTAVFQSFVQIHPSPELCRESFNNALYYNGLVLEKNRLLSRAIAGADSLTQDIYAKWQSCHRRLAKRYARPIAERKNIAAVEIEAEGYEKLLQRNLPAFQEHRKIPDWRDVQNSLGSNEAAVEFTHYRYCSPDQTDSVMYAAMILVPGVDYPQIIPLFEEKQLTSLLLGANAASRSNILYASRGVEPTAGGKNLSYKLYQLIWKPLVKSLKRAETVYYVPSGVLCQLNLGAIPTGNGKMLADDYRLIALGSTRQLTVHTETNSNNNDAVLFGGIQYDMDSTAILTAISSLKNQDMASRGVSTDTLVAGVSRGNIWNFLKGTEEEVKELDLILSTAGFNLKIQKGFDATEEAFKAIGTNGPSPRVLHLATHGFFFPNPKDTLKQRLAVDENETGFKSSDNPLIRSGLLLAGANYAWETGKPFKKGMENGILTAYEISQMNLSNTELVVLSACETGLGDIQGNEGVYGLQRAFKIAGAKYLIMSLWQVPDKQTSLLMTTFYKKWLPSAAETKEGKEEKMTIPEAFRAAQKELREAGLDPYQWAGFVLVE